LKSAARVVVDMVDPPEDGVPDARSLLERLREAPAKISGFVSENTKVFVSHVFGLVKSHWPRADVSPLAEGMAADCSEEKFAEYLEEVKLVAHKIVETLGEDQGQ